MEMYNKIIECLDSDVITFISLPYIIFAFSNYVDYLMDNDFKVLKLIITVSKWVSIIISIPIIIVYTILVYMIIIDLFII